MLGLAFEELPVLERLEPESTWKLLAATPVEPLIADSSGSGVVGGSHGGSRDDEAGGAAAVGGGGLAPSSLLADNPASTNASAATHLFVGQAPAVEKYLGMPSTERMLIALYLLTHFVTYLLT